MMPDPEQDADHCFHRHHLEHQGNPSDQAEDRDHGTVQYRVAPPGPHGLPARMTDVDRGRERVAQARRHDRAEPVDQQGRPCIVPVAGRFRTFQVLERTDHVEQRHREDNGEVLPSLPVRQKSEHVGKSRSGEGGRQTGTAPGAAGNNG